MMARMDDGSLLLLALQMMLYIYWDGTNVTAPVTRLVRYLYLDFQLGVVSGYMVPVRRGEPVLADLFYHKYDRYRALIEECENEGKLVRNRDELVRGQARE